MTLEEKARNAELEWDNVTGTELVGIRDGVQLFSTDDLSNGVT